MKTGWKRMGASRRQMLEIGAAAVGATLFAPAVVSAVAQTRTKLRIVNSGSTTVQTMQELLKQQGYLDEFGLDLETSNVSDGSKVLAALVGGGLDVCMLAGISSVIPAIEKGAPVKVIAGALLKSNSVIYTSRPDIKSVKDLAGRTIGAGAVDSTLQYLVEAVLRKHGVDPSSVKFVNVGSATDVFKAVAAGVVDAGPSQVEYMASAGKFNVHALPDGAFWEEVPDYSDQGSYTTDQTIGTKRDAIVHLLAAYGKLYRFVCGPNSKDAYLAARLAAIGPKADVAGGVALWEWFQKYQPYAVNLVLSEDRVKLLQDVNVKLGIQKAYLPYDGVVDASLARDAVQLLGGPVQEKIKG